MSCIFYQDEIGVCCINGLDMQDFSKNKRCVEDDGYGCKLKITVTDARNMKQKLNKIEHLLRTAPIPPEEIPDAVMKILLQEEVR